MKKLNKLTFKTEPVDLEQGDGMGKYLAFYFYIDGTKLFDEEYNPANCFDILDEEAIKNNIVVICHCGCGVWGCSSFVARVKYTADGIVEWTADDLRCSKNPQTFYFDKAEYEKTMANLYNTARIEEAEVLAEKNKYFFLKMMPDISALFLNDNPDDEEYGFVIGDEESLSIPQNYCPADNEEDEKNEITVNFNIDGLSAWLSMYVHEALVPVEAEETTIEALSKDFDWKSFHRQGLKLAAEVKKMLPENVILKYSAPYEDASGLLRDDILIDDDPWYVQNVLEKLLP